MPTHWRELFHEAPQATQLAAEEVLINSVARGLAEPTFRFLIFNPPSVLIGIHQAVSQEVYEEEVKKLRWEIGRRPTGGGAILMGAGQLGWEAYIPTSFTRVPAEPANAMKEFAEAVSSGLKKMGLNANFRPKNDLEIGGRKISGMGAFSVPGAVSVVGTVLIDFDVLEMVRVLKISTEKLSDKSIKSMEERVTWASKELSRNVSRDEVIKAVREGIEEKFNVKLVKGDLTKEEKTSLPPIVDRYSSEDWIYGTRKAEHESGIGEAALKSPGGLIRAQTKIQNGVLTQVLITGDFFAQPSRGIVDLEARLKWIRADPDEIRKIVTQHFQEGKVKVLGANPEEFVTAIVQASKNIQTY